MNIIDIFVPMFFGGVTILLALTYRRTSCFLFYVPIHGGESEVPAHFLYCFSVKTKKGLLTHSVSPDNQDNVFLM